ncbi:hypothetical protein [Streptomyces sp. JW3]|uniref:hypothetical protein n=1 Tax=Streptomyces sp. JW3 TaxID=3456955 RepID=UPI003FA444F6
MADKQGGWLDRETAERMLRGEPPVTGDPVARARAERLAASLATLAAPAPPAGPELPGEAAALAAYRAARAAGPEAAGETVRAGGPDGSRTPLVRIGRTGRTGRTGGRDNDARRLRRPRPLRLGLAAMLAAGMVGGVAVAAGTGALTPFGDAPEPASSASGAVSPDRPLMSPSPRDAPHGEGTDGSASTTPTGEDTAEKGSGGATAQDPGTDTGLGAGGDDPADAGADAREGLAGACRDLRSGEELDRARGRALTEAAGGSARVRGYCAEVLADSGAKSGKDGDDDHDSGKGRGGSVKGDDDGDDGDDGGDEGKDDHASGADGARPTRNASVLMDTGADGEGDDGRRHDSGGRDRGGDSDGHHDSGGRSDRPDTRRSESRSQAQPQSQSQSQSQSQPRSGTRPDRASHEAVTGSGRDFTQAGAVSAAWV